MAQLKNITFITNAGGAQTLRLQDYETVSDIEYWFDNDVAISGRIRQNMRGIRTRYRVSYDACVQPGQYRSIMNNIVSDLTSGQETISISEGDEVIVSATVVPTERFVENIEYSNTIGLLVPEMEFIEHGINRTGGGTYVDEGFVETGYVF